MSMPKLMATKFSKVFCLGKHDRRGVRTATKDDRRGRLASIGSCQWLGWVAPPAVY